MPTVLTSTGIQFPDATIQTTKAQYPYKNAQLFTASGTWTVPEGITQVFVIVVGGGGGGAGAGGNNIVNGNGGYGGAGYATVSVSGSVAVTVGTGGAGSNSGNGAAGTSSIFSTVTATGGGGGVSDGANGATGTATGADFISFCFYDLGKMFGYAIPNSVCFSVMNDIQISRTTATSSTSALAYTAGNVSRLSPGARGEGETVGQSNATGGVGGAVLIFY